MTLVTFFYGCLLVLALCIVLFLLNALDDFLIEVIPDSDVPSGIFCVLLFIIFATYLLLLGMVVG